METKNVFHADEFISAIGNYVSEAEKAFDKQVKNAMKSEVSDYSNLKISTETELLTQFKQYVTITRKAGTGEGTIPAEVYAVLMWSDAAYQIDKSPGLTFDPLNEGKNVKAIGNYTFKILDDEKSTVEVGGKTYTITNYLAKLTQTVTITEGSNQYIASWKYSTAKEEAALTNLITTVAKSGADYTRAQTNKLFTSLGEDIYSYWLDALKAIDSDSALTKLASKLKDYYDIGKDIDKAIKKLFPKNADSIIKESDAYADLQKYTATLMSEKIFKNDTVSGDDVKNLKSFKNFIAEYNSLAKMLGLAALSYSLVDKYVVPTIDLEDVDSSVVLQNDKTLINGTDEDDEIYSRGEYDTISGNNGDDSIMNFGRGSYIYGGNGKDSLVNSGEGTGVRIYGNADDDTIYNLGDSVTIDGGDNDDRIYNHGKNVTIYGGSGNDYISNGSLGDSVKIDGGAGDDTIVSYGDSVSIDAGSGNDTISVYGNSSTVYCSLGSNKVSVYGSDTAIRCGEKRNDSVKNTFYIAKDAKNVTIFDFRSTDTLLLEESNYSAQEVPIYSLSNHFSYVIRDGDGNIIVTLYDVISKMPNVPLTANTADNPGVITGKAGGDTIENTLDYTKIIAPEGDNLIRNYGGNSSVVGNYGKDTIYNTGNFVDLSGGGGDDAITNEGDSGTISGGDGNDYISNDGNKSNISGGTGDDRIYNDGNNSTVYGDDGDDRITNSGDGSTISGGDGDDSVFNSGAFVTIDSGDGNDSITNDYYGSYNVSINGGEGNDSIFNYASYVTIDGGTGNDAIVSDKCDHISINAGTGNDTVDLNGISWGGGEATINGGAGDDSIHTNLPHVSINGGTGNDVIMVNGGWLGSKVTVDGGEGNDLIDLSDNTTSDLIEYKSGDGNDTVSGFNETDSLKISGGSYSSAKSGNDVILTVGDGKISLVGAAKLSTLNIIGTYKTDTTPPDTTPPDTTPPDTTPANTTLTITNADKSPVTLESSIEVVDASARTKAVKITGNELDNTITGGKGNDTLDGGNGDDLLTGGNGADVFVLSAGNDTITDYGTDNDKISIGSAQIKDFGANGSDFVFEFEDGSLTLTDAAGKKISVTGKTTQIYDANGIFNSARTAVTLNSSTENFSADSKLVTIDAGLTSNATITGNSKANKISLGNENVFIWSKGGNDTLENFGEDDTLKISGSVSDGTLKSGNTYLKIGSNKITVKDSAQITFTDNGGTKIFDGGIFYDEDKISATLTTAVNKYTATENVTNITGNAKANTLTGSVNETTLTGGKGNDLFINAGGNDFITDYGTGSDKISLGSSLESFSVTDSNVELELVKGSVTIANGAGKKISLVSGGKTTANIFSSNGIFSSAGTAVTLNASAKNFTANSKLVTIDAGLTSNATITGNSKANKISLGDENVFIWSKGGNDTLENFGEDDTLKISGSVSDASVKGGNTYIKIGSNKITVKDSAQVTFTDNDGTKIFDDGIFYDEDKFSATLGSAVKDFTATENITDITGNTKANKLYAGTEDTTLTGGKGNDSLWGGSGSDIFCYAKGDGKDIIYNFGSDDLLEIVGLNGEVTGKFNSAGNELTVKVGNTSVALLKDFGSTTTFNVTANGTAHQITK